MKKIILSLAASGLCLSLFGCSSAVAPTQSTAESTETAASASSTEAAQTYEAMDYTGLASGEAVLPAVSANGQLVASSDLSMSVSSDIFNMSRIGGDVYQIDRIYDVENSARIRNSINQIIADHKASGDDFTFDDPLLIANPFGTNSSSIYVYFETEEPAKISYTVTSPDGSVADFTRTLDAEAVTEHEYNLVGLVPGANNSVTLSMEGSDETYTFGYTPTKNGSEEITLKTTTDLTLTSGEGGYVDSHEMTLAAEKSDKEQSEGLFTVISNYDDDHIPNIYLYDNEGVLRGEIAQSKGCSGTLVFDGDVMYYAISESDIARVNSLGQVEAIYNLGSYSEHHDFCLDDKGNLLILASDGQGKEVEDIILFVDTKTGETTGALDLSDLFHDYEVTCVDNTDTAIGSNGKGMDWMHINSIVFNNGDAFLSSRETSSILKINDIEGTPSIGYIIGSKDFWSPSGMDKYLLEQVGDFELQGGQHNLSYIPTDEDGVYYISMYNNNMGLSTSQPDFDWTSLGMKNLKVIQLVEPSYFYEYKIDENKGTFELAASFPVPTSNIVSSAQTLSNGNVVTDSGVAGIFAEYDSTGKLIKGYSMNLMSKFIYRCFKFDYNGFWFNK
ncbi:MAG: aryl-sulfate sulfotransferase [Lachnospiraceae bacterium]|nr:aryl-sulfate sulfotransferase [Lachnospiraceae bacterium]